MSIRLMDEIYGALHKNEKPPFTNSVKEGFKTDLAFVFDAGEIKFVDLSKFKFNIFNNLPIIEPPKYIGPSTVD